MTVREAMLISISSLSSYPCFTIKRLDNLTCHFYPGIFQYSTACRVAQELVKEGVLIRLKRGVYKENHRVVRKLKWTR